MEDLGHLWRERGGGGAHRTGRPVGNDLPVSHDESAISGGSSKLDVVGGDDDCCPVTRSLSLGNLTHDSAQLSLHGVVQTTGRFVEQNDVGTCGQLDGQHQCQALALREITWVAPTGKMRSQRRQDLRRRARRHLGLHVGLMTLGGHGRQVEQVSCRLGHQRHQTSRHLGVDGTWIDPRCRSG